jgi:DNA-binding transcriptional LysR family regulator
VSPGESLLRDAQRLEQRDGLGTGQRQKKVSIHASGSVSSRDFDSVSGFVRRGHGVGLLPSTYCDEAIAKGELVRLLPEWASPHISVFAVYSSRKFPPLRLSVFLEALVGWKSPLWIKD